MGETEDPLGARAVPDQRVERRQQRRAVPASRRIGQRGGVGPRRACRQPSTWTGTSPVSPITASTCSDLEPVVVGEIGAGARRRAPARPGPTSRRTHSSSSGSSASSIGGKGALGQVVHPLPAAALDATDIADVEQPLHRDLHLGPVPPLAAVLGAAELCRGERSLGAQLGQHLRAGLLRQPGASAVRARGETPGGGRRSTATPRWAGRRPRATSTRRRGRPAARRGAPVRRLDPRPGRPAPSRA